MKKIKLTSNCSENNRKELYRIVLKEFSKRVDEYIRAEVDEINRDLMQNKDNKSNE